MVSASTLAGVSLVTKRDFGEDSGADRGDEM